MPIIPYTCLDIFKPSNFNPYASRRRRVWIVSIAALLFFLTFLGQHYRTFSFLPQFSYPLLTPYSDYKGPLRRRVAIASDFSHHFDVHLAVAHTFTEILGPNADLRVFAHTPLLHGFQEVIEQLGLYKVEIKPPDDFLAEMKSDKLYPEEPGAMIDLVVFGTCEVDMQNWSTELLALWDERLEHQKFKVVCIVHNFRDRAWQEHITPWASRGAIRLLPIASHVGRTFRAHFQELADSTDRSLYSALYEYIDIDVHVPVLNLPEYGQRRTPETLERAVIQGNFQTDRRDYAHIFEDLTQLLELDAEAWGYQSRSSSGQPYEPISDGTAHPFTLHLIGDGHLDVPHELSNVVLVHRGLSYFDFYALMQSMDVVLPAFVNVDYYDNQASSTVAMAVQCNVPVLATQRMRKAYGYIDDDRVIITRPQAIREIEALSRLRSDRSELSNTTFFPRDLRQDIDGMLHSGWRRSRAGFEHFKQDLWRSNRESVWRIMNDLQGRSRESADSTHPWSTGCICNTSTIECNLVHPVEDCLFIGDIFDNIKHAME